MSSRECLLQDVDGAFKERICQTYLNRSSVFHLISATSSENKLSKPSISKQTSDLFLALMINLDNLI